MSSHLAIAVVGAVVIIDNLLAVDRVQFKVILRDQAFHLAGIDAICKILKVELFVTDLSNMPSLPHNIMY